MKYEQLIIGVMKDRYYRWWNWWGQFSPSRIWRLICIKRKMDDIRYCENLIREHICKMRMYGVPTEDFEKELASLRKNVRGEKNMS